MSAITAPAKKADIPDTTELRTLEGLGKLLGMRKLALAALLMSLTGCSDVFEERYDTWAEAEEAGAIKRGWIPEFVPRGARDLHEKHNIDTNAQTLKFTVPPSEIPSMISGLRSVASKEAAAAVQLAVEAGWHDERDATATSLPSEAEAFVVCSELPLHDPWVGALQVERGSGRATYMAPVQGLDDHCPEGEQA